MKTKFYKLCLLALVGGLVFITYSCHQDDLIIPKSDEAAGVSIEKDLIIDIKGKKSYARGQAGLMINDRFANFAFHATKDSDGNVSGSWEAHAPGQGARTHGTIECMEFVDDKTAYMYGTFTQIVPGVFAWAEVGDSMLFKVRDNGEGGNSEPDQYSDYFLWPREYYCEDIPEYYMMDIVNGNIQVKRYTPKN